MAEPSDMIESVRVSTAALLAALDGVRWSDGDVRAPSLLPGWTRGHVLTHLARNADGIALTLDAARRGADLPRYPLGLAGRNADIEAGSGRTARDLIADVRISAEGLDRVFAEVLGEDARVWGRTADGRAAAQWPAARWREVEIHRVDLDSGYGPSQWPPEFVAHELPPIADTLAERAGVPAIRMTVAAPDSLNPALVGRTWSTADNAEIDVAGPDWALFAWLVGRPSVAAERLSATPELPPWR